MEESSEAHMETDVSSTTQDLPDTQEVTDSNGTVELVIVVEKVSEENMNEKAEKTLDKDVTPSTVPEEPPLADNVPQQAGGMSPTKQIEPETTTQTCTSTKSESPKKTLVSNSPLKPQSPITTENEKVDSSSKSEETKSQNIDSQEKTEENIVVSTDSKKGEEQLSFEITQSQDTLKTNDENRSTITDTDPANATESTENKNKEEPNIPNNIIQVDISMEASNDSQLDTNSDISEKEHNKSISRELKSLINSAKESKIISECTQLTSKTRKSRVILDSSNTSLNTSMEADKIQGVRRHSNNSQKSNCSEKSDKVPLKRSMRSQNPEFVSKVKQFLNSVTGKNQKEDEMTDDEIEEKSYHKNDESLSNTSTPKKRKVEDIVMNKATKLRSDSYCWRCHWAVENAANEKTHQPMLCTVCPRSFHFKCLSGVERNKINVEKNWVCPDCLIILHAESSETRSPAMKKISLGMLCELLQHALERMMDLNGVEPFMTPVDRSSFPDYDKYVVHPMDLSLMKSNIADGLYGSTEAFLADAQWILHNSIIFNTLQSKLTGGARALVRSCRAEMGEIEACPECYAAAHARRPTWFTDVCSTPHILLWAKLKGFPYWPAKGMSVSGAGLVDVRFFGAHDRAWVPAKDCFLYSEKDPNGFRTKRQDILDSMQEAEQHIRNISRKYGKFVYPPFKTQLEPMKLNEQLKIMIPTFDGEVRMPAKLYKANGSPTAAKEKSRSNSKSSKSSCNDGDISEVEDPLASSQVKEDSITSNDNDSSTNKSKVVETDAPKTKDNKETESAKKRRRSQLEEAVITILDNGPPEKRKRLNEGKTDDTPEPSSSKETSHKDKDREKTNNKQEKMEEKMNASKGEELNSTQEKDTTVAKEKVEKPTVAPFKISLATNKNGKQTARVSTVKESPKANTSNERSVITFKASTPKEDKSIVQKIKNKTDKLFIIKKKEEKVKSEKRRNSKSNRSSNGNTPKAEKQTTEKKNEKPDNQSTNNKDKLKESVTKTNNKITAADKADTIKSSPIVNNSKTKDPTNDDDNTSLALIARGNKINKSCGLPTISSIRSLSTGASTSNTNLPNPHEMVEVTIEGSPEPNIFTPTSTDTIRNMKEATTKLQKLRENTESLVGKVGVRAFARMTSPEKKKNDSVQVEIKSEPIDLDDADRHMEKMDLMNAFKLRPVNPPSSLREVRMNKVVITPLNRKIVTKVPEIRPRAKKTFPHPKKPEDGQLNGKNSMVYIPIQPPVSQAPTRVSRPATVSLVSTGHRPLVSNATGAKIVNAISNAMVPVMSSMSNSMVSTTAAPSVPTVGQVPTTVHTVPLMTSVNGQWMFSLQPVMSVGGVDAQASPPLVNGVSERNMVQAVVSPALPSLPTLSAPPPQLAAIAPAPATAPVLAPAPAPTPAAVLPTNKSTTDANTPGEPPRLQQRPVVSPLDASSPLGAVPPPSSVGPLTAKLNQNAVKLTDFFRSLLEDSLEKLEEPASQLTALRLHLEQAAWKHQQHIDEIKHNHELTLAEVRASFDKEKSRAVSEARRLAQIELEAAVKQAKSKQWCAHCSQEAQFYCCWNTSYCDYGCQRAHWNQHYHVCAQTSTQEMRKSNGDASSTADNNRLQPQSENLPKSTPAPPLTVGGKLAAARNYNQDQQNNAQKTSIIMSMVSDNSGNQTMKCVGTYTQNPPAPATAPVTSLLINKQLSAEEANGNKKMVTSGGYLIVGGGVNTRVNASVNANVNTNVNANVNVSVNNAARQMHTIQYYT